MSQESRDCLISNINSSGNGVVVGKCAEAVSSKDVVVTLCEDGANKTTVPARSWAAVSSQEGVTRETSCCSTDPSLNSENNNTMGGFVTKGIIRNHHGSSMSSNSSDSGEAVTLVTNGNNNCDTDPTLNCLLDGMVITPEYNTPIIGYEVMEERARFTVFKIRVEHADSGQSWYVFRRYTDFTRLNKKLRELFPGLRLSLPPKRWFGDNFDPMFLEDRLLGLQAYVKNIMCHKDISKTPLIREFFCLDDPPEPLDTIEESRALCQNLEEIVYRLAQQVKEKDAELEMLRAEVALLKTQQNTLVKALKIQNETNSSKADVSSDDSRDLEVIDKGT